MTLGLGRAAVVKIAANDRLRDGRRGAASGRSPRTAPPAAGRSRSSRRSAPRRRRRSTRSPRSPTSPSARACGSTSTRLRRRRRDPARSGARPFAGWERADSIVVNPHKWLFTPLDASLLLTPPDGPAARGVQPRAGVPADARPRRAPSTTTTSTSRSSGRRMRALKLWMQLRWFGLDGLRRRIAAHLERGAAVRGLGRRGPRLGAARAGPVLDRLLPLPPGRRWRADERGPAARRAQHAAHGRRQPHRRGVPVAHPAARPVHDPPRDRQPAHGAAPRGARVGAAPSRGRRACDPRRTTDDGPDRRSCTSTGRAGAATTSS